jgi:hypothetical protein
MIARVRKTGTRLEDDTPDVMRAEGRAEERSR